MGAPHDGDGGRTARGVVTAIAISAPGKLTLTLAITGIRGDGYHLIDAEMVSLELADTLWIDPEGDGLSAEGPYSAGVPLDSSNLVTKALRLANRTAGVRIDKQIPHGGGLGGGSADAAAVLRWAGHSDLASAARLGADVPFCVVGGRARVTGIGEIVEALDPQPSPYTLVIPPLSCSTPAVYRAWDALGGPTGDGPNDLLAAALVVEPRLNEWRSRIREAAGAEPVLAGSGATWFLPGHHPHLTTALTDAHVVITRSQP